MLRQEMKHMPECVECSLSLCMLSSMYASGVVCNQLCDVELLHASSASIPWKCKPKRLLVQTTVEYIYHAGVTHDSAVSS